MNKRFSFYAVAWAALLILFNVIAFVSVGWSDTEKYTASFWIGYVFISLMFIGHLLCAFISFKDDTSKKTFYNLSIIGASYIGLIASFVIGGLCMIISPLPYWVGVIACAIVLIANALTLVKAKAAIAEVERIDEKVKTQTFFIKSLTADIQTLMLNARSDAVKAECSKVYEAVRYSDPMSNTALASVESQITVKYSELSEAVQSDNPESAAEIARVLCILIGDRNNKCKLLK